MSANEIHQSDIGTVFLLTVTDNGVAVDISDATTKTIKFMKPDRSVVEKTGLLYSDGTDGKLYYTTVANDLNMAGTWKVQAYVQLPAWRGHSDIVTFTVYPNLS